MTGEDARYVETSPREAWWRWKYLTAVHRFRSGKEGELTFRAVLKDLGFRGQELEAEVRIARL